MEIPAAVEELLGTNREFGGGLFSSNKESEPAHYNVLDWRWGSGTIMNMETFEELHPTFELLLKNDDMKRSRWTRGFPARDFIPDGDEGFKKDVNYKSSK